MKNLTLMFIDDHQSYCEGLVGAIRAKGLGYKLLFQSDAEKALEYLCNSAGVDLLISDILMPAMSGVEMLRRLRVAGCTTPALFLSAIEDIEQIKCAISLSGSGFAPKSYSIEEIILAIEDCLSGKKHIPLNISREINKHSFVKTEKRAPYYKITQRQQDVLNCLNMGLANEEIADCLYLSLATVKTHLNNLYQTFNVKSRLNCLRQAKKYGLLKDLDF